MRGERGHQTGARAGDHVPAFVEHVVVAVVGVGHVDSRPGGGVEGTQQHQADGICAEPSQGLKMSAIERDQQVDPGRGPTS